MRKPCITGLLCLFFSYGIGQLSAPVARKFDPAPAGNTYALVIGIANYENRNIPNLNYSNRDAQVFADYLKSKAGGSVPQDNIRLLIDTVATTAAVYNALDWLRDKCEEDNEADKKTVNTIYFYYSGHGDVESQTMQELGYLLTYNSPSNNYINNALRLEDLNYYANTYSGKFNAKVILITDACHSGKLAGSDFHGSELVGRALSAEQQNQIRIAACAPNELSNENPAWGGGRGIFSWYLVNGLKGLADKNHDNIVTVDEIRSYLDSNIAHDPVLKQNNLKQTPVLTGKNDFKLAAVNKTELAKIQSLTAPMLKLAAPSDKDYFFSILKSRSLVEQLDFSSLARLNKEDIPVALIDQVQHRLDSSFNLARIAHYKQTISADKTAWQACIESLVEDLHNAGQSNINLYLQGDAAELERRSYYNIKGNGYDIYPPLYDVTLKLVPPDIPLYRILQVNKYYFTGLIVRLKIPSVEDADQKKLIDSAFALQQKAKTLQPDAAYIQNELGVLFEYKNKPDSAAYYFQQATKLAPSWAIPYANLGQLDALQKKFTAGLAASSKADSLQAGLHTTNTSFGLNYELQGDQLRGEEYYRKAIDINSRHYFPFERLGYVYMNTTQYAQSDSFFHEAEIRKKGYHFNGSGFDALSVLAPAFPLGVLLCPYDSSQLKKDDIMGLFYWAMDQYERRNFASAERIFRRIIALDSTSPLVFHYLGKVFYDQKKWEPAELFFKFALRYQLDGAAFKQYADSLSRVASMNKYPYDHACFDSFYRANNYAGIEDNYFIASVYENWGHLAEAENAYRKIMQLSPDQIGGYIKLWQLMERSARYNEAEKLILDFRAQYPPDGDLELNAFYKRAIQYYPYDWNWPLKLGNLLYGLGMGAPTGVYIDTIIYFPLMNQEIFIDMDRHNTLAANPKMLLDRNSNRSLDTITQLPLYFMGQTQVTLTGTQEKVLKALAPIYTPREDGIFYLTKAAQLISDTSTLADIHFKVGDLYLRAGSPKQAFPYYDSSIQYNTKNANARMKMIDVSRVLYRNSTALKHLDYLNDSLQISYPYSLILGEFSIHEGKFEKAKKILTQAQALYPYAVPSTYDLLGRLNLLAHQPAQAINYYKTYLDYHLKDAETDYTLAKLYAQSGNESESWKWLENALQKGFSYSYILNTDPVWNNYRSQPQWNKLMASVNMKTYLSPAQ